jgi:hypothetical protein
VDSKNIVCHVNSSACRVYVTFFYSTTSISFYKSFYTFRVFTYLLQLHFRGHFRVHFRTSTPTFICGCTAVSTVLQLHFRGHFRVHFRTSTPTFICGRTATSLFYTYTHLWMYSGLCSATATFSRPISCTFSYQTSVDVSILCLHSSPHLYILHIISASTSTPAFTLSFSSPSLALFSRWQRVHGYTSLIRPRFHSSLHSTSTFSKHFRDPGIYIRSTFYIYILQTFSYI